MLALLHSASARAVQRTQLPEARSIDICLSTVEVQRQWRARPDSGLLKQIPSPSTFLLSLISFDYQNFGTDLVILFSASDMRNREEKPGQGEGAEELHTPTV